MRLVLSVAIFIFCSQTSLWATHIVGGEITYRCIGNHFYEITLTVYRDCYNGEPAFDNPAIIGVYVNSPDSLLYKSLTIYYNDNSNDTLPIILNDPCLTVPPNVCVHKATYRSTTLLPYNPNGYILVYQRCCRNKLVRNLPDPLNTGICFTAEISAQSQLLCNQGATFNQWPPVAICVHHPIDFDHSASDADGDSLAYRLCTPFLGPDSTRSAPNPPNAPPYAEVIWQDPPYNLSNLLGGDPLTIDPYTGFMTGIPSTIGNFVVGVCVDEFRDDTLISTTRRDFQYNVADCGEPQAAFFLPEILCDTLSVHFLNQSKNTNFFRWYFDWENDLSQTSNAPSPTHIYPDTGLYTVALIAAPNFPCADTFFQQIHLLETIGDLAISAVPDDIIAGDASQLNAAFPGAISYAWSPISSLSDQASQNPVASPLQTTTYAVTATLPNGCQRLGSVTVRVSPPPCEEPYIFFPTGFSPNGDGENDYLKLEASLPPESLYWAIYNRWGEKVFETTEFDAYWDGSYHGKDQPAETYGYQLRVTCFGGQTLFIKGNVTLLR